MSGPRLQFDPPSSFQQALKARVDAYFDRCGLPRRGHPAVRRKTVVLFGWAAASYGILVFGGLGFAICLVSAISLGFALAGIGFNVQHDASHGAFSPSPLVNRWMAFSLDLMGGSSDLYRIKHGVQHHTFSNVVGQDADIHVSPVLRLAPTQPRYLFHRLQFLYAWVLYSLVVVKWQLFDDAHDLLTSRIADQPFPRLEARATVRLLVGKVLFLSWAILLPSLFHPLSVVLVWFIVVASLMSVLLALFFQLAHCLSEAEFPVPDAAGAMGHDWAVHQLRTTVDFGRESNVLRWYLGGLNFQIEHHLFPGICHGHYPAIAHLVEETCAEFGVPYRAHRSLGQAVASHVRWLRAMGSAEGLKAASMESA